MNAMFPKFIQEDPRALANTRERFKEVFSSEQGKDVLTSILSILRFYVPAENIGDLERQNAAKEILFLAGLWDDGKERQIVNKLMGGS